jgi:hypothetical protein
MTTPEQPYDPKAAKQEALGRQIREMHAQLSQVANNDVPTLPERIFVGVFLPWFAGDAVNPYKMDLMKWLEVSRGPFRPVNIVNPAGEVLFQVPPIQDRAAINPLTQNRVPFSHLVTTATQLSLMSPVQASQYMESELTQRALIMKVPVAVEASLEEWNAIFRRYGRPELKSATQDPTSAPAEPAAKTNPSGDDIEDFDLL